MLMVIFQCIFHIQQLLGVNCWLSPCQRNKKECLHQIQWYNHKDLNYSPQRYTPKDFNCNCQIKSFSCIDSWRTCFLALAVWSLDRTSHLTNCGSFLSFLFSFIITRVVCVYYFYLSCDTFPKNIHLSVIPLDFWGLALLRTAASGLSTVQGYKGC